jgi:hypothetical protein
MTLGSEVIRACGIGTSISVYQRNAVAQSVHVYQSPLKARRRLLKVYTDPTGSGLSQNTLEVPG